MCFVEGGGNPADDPYVTTVPTRIRKHRHRRTVALVAAVATAAASFGVIAPSSQVAAGEPTDDDWLGVVNTYRAMSGLAPVTANSTWSSEGQAHSCYMLLNGITHDETPGAPGYTPGGDTAGNSGNVAVSSSIDAKARHHIDLWMTGPFHAIGILRHNLTQSGFGLCTNANPPTPWRSGGTLDVIRGMDYSKPRPAEPILFPGEGQTIPLNRFITESPNPMSMCGWTGNAGLPLIAMMPNGVSSANSTITGPSGPISTCTLHPGNTSGTARSILNGDNAVVVMPRDILADGTYTATVNTNSGNVTWSFDVATDAPLQYTTPEPEPLDDTEPASGPSTFSPVEPFRLVDTRRNLGATRLIGGTTTRIVAAPIDVSAVSANFIAVDPSAPGHLTVYNCGAEVPTVSTVNYTPGTNTANQAVVPLDRGAVCVYAHATTHLVVDVNGFYRGTASDAAFEPVTPNRIYDSRNQGGRLRAGVERRVKVIGVTGGAPSGANAVAMNVTAIGAASMGHLQVYPCGASASLQTSSVNYLPGEARPNTVVVGADEDGYVCLNSLRDLHVAMDVTGYFGADASLDFTPLNPVRLFDSRRTNSGLNEMTNGTRVRAGEVVRLQVAGERGVPADAKAASVNITATLALQGLHVTAYPCGPRPGTSNVNVVPGQTVANGAMVSLSNSGELCLYALRDVHLIVDINGVWN